MIHCWGLSTKVRLRATLRATCQSSEVCIIRYGTLLNQQSSFVCLGTLNWYSDSQFQTKPHNGFQTDRLGILKGVPALCLPKLVQPDNGRSPLPRIHTRDWTHSSVEQRSLKVSWYKHVNDWVHEKCIGFPTYLQRHNTVSWLFWPNSKNNL